MSIGTWLRDRPALLERVYDVTHTLFTAMDPLIQRIGYERTDRLIRGPEEFGKKVVFDCRMCGQCILHSTGMTCPMSCPKNLRNGPCGGVRANGHCEGKPEMRCVWVEAYERSQRMPMFGNEILWIEPPVNRQLEGTSAWVNMLTGVDTEVPKAWQGMNTVPDVPGAPEKISQRM